MIRSALLIVATLPSLCWSATPESSQPSSRRPPWWINTNLAKTVVDDNFDWDERDSGAEEDGETYFVEWTHLDRKGLEEEKNGDVVPWTQGRLIKHLQRRNATSFHLRNLFEESAVGHWLGGWEHLKQQQGPASAQAKKNGLLKQEYTFHQTPRRVTELPMRLPEHWPVKEAASSRVTLCGKGVVSGPRWLPNDYEQSDELLHKDYLRLEFAEMWLALDQDSRQKVGLFVEYHGSTGELKQMFLMRQARVPNDHQYPGKDVEGNSNLDTSSLDSMEKHLRSMKLWPVLPTEKNAASKAFRKQPDINEFLQKRHWKGRNGVSVQIESPTGKAVRIETDRHGDHYTRPIDADDEHNLFYQVRCSDGVYCLIPKTFHPTYLDEDCCIELGCVTESGLQRILICGKRSKGLLDTCVYEEWGPSQDKQS